VTLEAASTAMMSAAMAMQGADVAPTDRALLTVDRAGKQGAEVLSDLGYLWDHPRKHETLRTLAHNTVLLDEQEQLTKERGGDVQFFRATPHVKVMQASSRAYAAAKTYRRTSAVVDHGDGKTYVVDFFRVQGGRQQDYVFHASAPTVAVTEATTTPAAAKLYDFTNVRAITSHAAWRATWRNGDQTCVAWNLPQSGETAFVGDGWGQRDWKNSDVGATLPYLVRRTTGDGEKVFVTVFASHPGDTAYVRGVRAVDAAGIIAIETVDGTDFVLSAADTGNLRAPGAPTLTGRFAVTSVQQGKVAWSFVEPEKP
ncbi:MAG: heparinase II/III family protein, partial [Verrucomicrobiota bacterium]